MKTPKKSIPKKRLKFFSKFPVPDKRPESPKILYGGSVNSGNAESLIQTEGVDGFLIGGASLDAGSFASIIKIVEEVQES